MGKFNVFTLYLAGIEVSTIYFYLGLLQ